MVPRHDSENSTRQLGPSVLSSPMGVAVGELAIAPIRLATRHRHTALEAVLELVAPLSRSRYVDALRGFDLFLSLWEPRMNAALPLPQRPWFAARSRRDLLRRDLAHLDDVRDVQEQTRSICEHAVAKIDLASAAGTFGSLYVLEGSALGGKVIARAARATLGLGRANGAAYFNGLDDHSAARWTSFQSLLEEQVGTEPLARQHACMAACQTFDALIVTFTSLCRDDVPV